MKPLLSGEEAKRFIGPATETFLLFPYAIEGGTVRLLTEAELAERFARAEAYLRGHETELRAREGGKFDDDQ